MTHETVGGRAPKIYKTKKKYPLVPRYMQQMYHRI